MAPKELCGGDQIPIGFCVPLGIYLSLGLIISANVNVPLEIIYIAHL